MGFPSSFSFLGIGIPEVLLIIVLALVVLGPERLPGVAKEIVKGFFRLRNLSKDLTGQLEQELGMEELKELNDLKDIKTGGLIEKWANDELDLNLDDDQAESAAASQETPAAAKAEPKPAPSAPASSQAAGQKVVATPPSAQTSPNGRNKVEVGSLIDSSVSPSSPPETATVSSNVKAPAEVAEPGRETVAVEPRIAPPAAAVTTAAAIAGESDTTTMEALAETRSCMSHRAGLPTRPRASLTRAWPSPNRTALRRPLAPIRMRQGKGFHGRLLLARWR